MSYTFFVGCSIRNLQFGTDINGNLVRLKHGKDLSFCVEYDSNRYMKSRFPDFFKKYVEEHGQKGSYITKDFLKKFHSVQDEVDLSVLGNKSLKDRNKNIYVLELNKVFDDMESLNEYVAIHGITYELTLFAFVKTVIPKLSIM